MKGLRSWKLDFQVLALRDLGLAHPPRVRRLLEGQTMKRVGRPPLEYDVKHVTINMKTEHYKVMRREGINMSRVINLFLDDMFAYTICPTCYGEDFIIATCAKCKGRMLVCNNIACKATGHGQRRECLKNPDGSPRHPEMVCTRDEFNG